MRARPRRPRRLTRALARRLPVLQNVKLGNLRITYRERGKPDRVALIETLSIGPGSAGLLALSGKGSLNELPASVSGELGPLDALFSGQNIRMAIEASLGDLRLDVNGGLGRLDPLDGADLALKVGHPDVGAMLKKLHLPVMVSGALSADARLADAGELTRLDLAAKLGDITLKVGGTLRALGLPGSDLRIDASVADAARLAAAFDVTGLPAGPLEVAGRVASSRTEISLDGLSARFAGARARVNGRSAWLADPSADLRFDLAAEPGQAAARAAGDALVHERQLRRQSRQARSEEPQGANRRERDLGTGVGGRNPQEAGGYRSRLAAPRSDAVHCRRRGRETEAAAEKKPSASSSSTRRRCRSAT